MRWILIDQFDAIEKGKFCRAKKAVSRSEEALIDDYPCFPVYPSSLMLEMMAQTGGVLVGATIDYSKEVVLAKITDAEFYRAVTAPCELVIEGTLADLGDDAAVTDCRILCAGELVAKAQVFFGLFGALGEGPSGTIVFSKDFMESFAIRQVAAKSAPGASR